MRQEMETWLLQIAAHHPQVMAMKAASLTTPSDKGVHATMLCQHQARRHCYSDLSAHAPLSLALCIHKSGCVLLLSGLSYRIFMVHPHPERI